MLNYQPGFRPPAPSPAQGQSPFLGQVPLASASRILSLLATPAPPHYDLGGRHPHVGQTFDEIAGIPKWSGDVLRVIFHGGTTWLGIRVGLREKNKWVSGIAWVLAVGNGLAGIADLISLIKRATGTHPVDQTCPKAPVTTSEPVPVVSAVPGTRSF